MIGIKSVPYLGKAAEFYEAVENKRWKMESQGKLEEVQKGMNDVRNSMQIILQTLRTTDIDAETLSRATESLFDLEQQAKIRTAFFEQLLHNSSHLPSLKSHPQNYGRILGDSETPANGKIHLIVDNGRKNIIEIAPIVFSTLLSSQKTQDASVRILDASGDMFAFPGTTRQRTISEVIPGKSRGETIYAGEFGEIGLINTFDYGNRVETVSLDPQGNAIIYGGKEGRIYQRNIGLGDDSRYVITSASAIERLQFSNDGKSYLSLEGAGNSAPWSRSPVFLHQTETGEKIRQICNERLTCDVAFSPDGTRIIAANAGDAAIYDMEGNQLMHISCPTNWMSGRTEMAVLRPDNKELAAICENGRVRTYDATSGKELQRLNIYGAGSMQSLEYGADGRELLATGGVVNLIDLAQNRSMRISQCSARSAYFHPRKPAVIIGTEDGILEIWSKTLNKTVISAKLDTSIGSLSISKNGNTMATGSYYENTVKVFDISRLKNL